MDGVVIDSEKLHLRALGLTLEQNGISFPKEMLNDFVGRSDHAFFEYAKEKLNNKIEIDRYTQQKDAIFDEISRDMQFITGFPDFMKVVKAKQIQTALVTSSTHHSVKYADTILHSSHFFDVIVAEEDTRKHKPNPEPYLLAIEKIKADKNSTIVIEDSINGVIAGKAAGCTVCGLTTSFDADTLIKAGADFVCKSYPEIEKKFNFSNAGQIAFE